MHRISLLTLTLTDCCRFGRIASVNVVGEDIHIEFSRRNEAETAKSRGAYFRNDVLSISWKEDSSPLATDPSSADANEAEPENY